MNEAKLVRVMRGEDRSAAGALLRGGLSLLTPGYRLAVAARNALFDAGLRRPVPLGRPTISVGNLTTGGTGKTPVVADLAQRLTRHGQRVAVLLRGYRGAGAGSDEARMLRELLGSVVEVEAQPSRVRGAAAVLARTPQTSVFLLDDGFQHRQAARDRDIVLIDASDPFGHGRLLPRGFLREPVSALRRADAVIVTRTDQATPDALSRLDRQIERWHGRAPAAHAVHAWDGFTTDAGEDRPLAWLKDQRVAGVCGIGNPGSFEASLRRHGGTVLTMQVFADHHAWTTDEALQIAQDARRSGAGVVVMTAKDFARWPQIELPQGLQLVRVRMSLRYLDGEDVVNRIVLGVTGSSAASSGAL